MGCFTYVVSTLDKVSACKAIKILIICCIQKQIKKALSRLINILTLFPYIRLRRLSQTIDQLFLNSCRIVCFNDQKLISLSIKDVISKNISDLFLQREVSDEDCEPLLSSLGVTHVFEIKKFYKINDNKFVAASWFYD